MVHVSILGATGYTGRVLLDLLSRHPKAALSHATTTSKPGVAIADVHPQLRGVVPGTLELLDVAKVARDSDVVFSCLPHLESMQSVAALVATNPKVKVVDLSADFRFQDAALYQEVYGHAHAAPKLLARAVYGLPELFRNQLKGATIVGNPGCYPTATMVPLAPFAKSGLIQSDVIVDAKSGVSGAGAKANETTHYVEANESFKAYSPLVHRHQPEMVSALAAAGAAGIDVQFVPHLVPMNRGILSSIYATLKKPMTTQQAEQVLADAYGKEPFVRVLPAGQLPDTKNVQGTNFVDVSAVVAPNGRRLLLLGAIDNLVKGASGQAVQNMNILAGLPETTGLLSQLKSVVTTEVTA